MVSRKIRKNIISNQWEHQLSSGEWAQGVTANDSFTNINTPDKLPKYNSNGDLLSYNDVYYTLESFNLKTVNSLNLKARQLITQLNVDIPSSIGNDNDNTIIKSELTNYLEFDVSKIFEVSDNTYIFGGSVRDIIAELSIHDVDILYLIQYKQRLQKLVIDSGYTLYKNMSEQYEMDNNSIKYDTMDVETYKNKNGKQIQLISSPYLLNVDTYPPLVPQNLIKNIQYVLTQVDLSSSGVYFYNNELGISINNAYDDCVRRQFYLLPNNQMYHKGNINSRVEKMESRGWTCLNKSILNTI
jgi:hypothetical protein